MAFPSGAVEQIDYIVRSKNLNSMPPHERAKWISSYLRDFKYGISEAVLSGKRFRYPHEIETQFSCGEAGVYIYMLAKACGLSPRLFRLSEPNGSDTDHFYVDADIDGHREALDVLYDLSGPVRYGLGRIKAGKKRINFNSIETLSEEEVQDFIDYINSPDGIIPYLSAKQKCNTFNGDFGTIEQYVSYSQEDQALLVDYILIGIQPWEIKATFKIHYPMAQEPSYRLQFGRNVRWGDLSDIFYEARIHHDSRKISSVLHEDVVYRGLKKRALRTLLYYIYIVACEDEGNGDGKFLFSGEDRTKFLESLDIEHSTGFLSTLKKLEEDNPEFRDRYVDYQAYVYVHYLKHEKAIRQKLWRDGDYDLKAILEMCADFLYRDTYMYWMTHLLTSDAIKVLSYSVQETTQEVERVHI